MQLRNRTISYAEDDGEDVNRFKSDIFEIKYQIAVHLQYKQIKIYQKLVQVKISKQFYIFLKDKMEIGFRFKPNDYLIEVLDIPISNLVDNTLINAINFSFNVRTPKPFIVNDLMLKSKPILGIRFTIEYNIN